MPAALPIIVAVSFLALASAPTLAQQQPGTSEPAAEQKAPGAAPAPMQVPNQTVPPRVESPAAPAPPQGESPAAPPRTAQDIFMPGRVIGQWMATDFIGSAVYGQNQEAVAEVKDMVIDHSGRIAAVVLSVGGFLGMGEKWVAVPYDAIRLTVRDGRAYLTIALTRADFEGAPSFSGSLN
jgi:sporulation protein YlmC with PRC-barrel domain